MLFSKLHLKSLGCQPVPRWVWALEGACLVGFCLRMLLIMRTTMALTLAMIMAAVTSDHLLENRNVIVHPIYAIMPPHSYRCDRSSCLPTDLSFFFGLLFPVCGTRST
ncbi:uncharacterized protein EI90DRAFT_3049039 [Cantharellus anzutake]|uniref:uncharacterized protein n=1 Tax=Cantharellus anzutake TaxID=1750568 RepID=UPI00190839B2|nr:uncharacterized protein EI90DRAFT_3049039 [Cantharellus anzutake]KAF8334958.1 hypothetical protein EI90DRAFT_3049039 [Cantharellus anzutake]